MLQSRDPGAAALVEELRQENAALKLALYDALLALGRLRHDAVPVARVPIPASTLADASVALLAAHAHAAAASAAAGTDQNLDDDEDDDDDRHGDGGESEEEGEEVDRDGSEEEEEEEAGAEEDVADGGRRGTKRARKE